MKHTKKFIVFSWLLAALALLAGCEVPLSEADGDVLTLSDVTFEVGKDGLTLQAALNTVKTAQPAEDAHYTIVIPAGELNLAPTTLTAAEGVEKTLTLKKAADPAENQGNQALFNQAGAEEAPVIKLLGKGRLFTVPAGVTLELADNITLVGTDDNDAPLLTVAGSLVLKDNALITENTNTADANKNGVELKGALTISGSAVVDGEGGVYVAGGGEITVAGELTPENGKAARIVVEDAAAGNAIVRGGGAAFFEAKDPTGGIYVVVDAPLVFESLAEMRAFLGSVPVNSVNTPYPLALAGVDVSEFSGGDEPGDYLYKLFAAFQGRYAALDLSACTGTEITASSSWTSEITIAARPDKDKLVSLILPDTLVVIGTRGVPSFLLVLN